MSRCCSSESAGFRFPRPPRSILVVRKRGPGSDEVRQATGALVAWLILRKQCAVWMERPDADEITKEQHALRTKIRAAPAHTANTDEPERKETHEGQKCQEDEPPVEDQKRGNTNKERGRNTPQPCAGNEGRGAADNATRTEQQNDAAAVSSSASCSSTSTSPTSLPAGLYYLSSPLRHSEIALIDFSISMGGDGTVLHLNALLNSLGEHTRMPPLLSFAMGTLGFLTNLYFDEHQAILERVLNAYEKPNQDTKDPAVTGDGSAQAQKQNKAEEATIVRPKPRAAESAVSSPSPASSAGAAASPSSCAARSATPACSSASPSPSPSVSPPPANDQLMLNPRMRLHVQVFRKVVHNSDATSPSSASSKSSRDDASLSYSAPPRYCFVGSYTCLNEVLVHRAASPFLASIDIQLLERHAPKGSEPFYITTVHGDGLMASTPTGSTAYSMAAGGPLIAPNSDSMVLTPVSPHSLSFRPIILSSCASVRFVIAANSRLGITERMVDGMVSGTPPPCECDGAPARRWAALASMDGHYQVLLGPGDYIQVTAARHPLDHIHANFPRMSNESQWLHNLTMKLHWNLTQSQLRLLEEQAKRGRNNQTSSAHSYRTHQSQHEDATAAGNPAAAGMTPHDDTDPKEKPAAPAASQSPSDKQQLQRLSQLPSNM